MVHCGTLMMFYSHEVFAFCHGNEIAVKLLGSTPHDQLLIETSDSFSGLLLFAVGILVFMVAFVKDRDFQSFFAKGCVLLHIAMAIWRIYFERKLEELGRDWLRLVLGDFVLSIRSWMVQDSFLDGFKISSWINIAAWIMVFGDFLKRWLPLMEVVKVLFVIV
ncbi:hypothetical protein L1987_02343 [Smallanthus sonchifolius]|uniref:Uncharacterized protein n=1 Tax=Smallanthus sonchifolius TaxID=185202 RepID=A0ACB9K7J7_9ASTR|nr:hypothetical protein L1987_02343 [Smallanthus sonchifolius]